MKRNFETHCWLCNSTDLEPDDRGIHCRSCGATYNVTHKPAMDCIKIAMNLATGKPDTSPSNHVTETARRAREAISP